MKVLEIVDWNENFENNRTRELKILNWVPIPNKMDGDGYTQVMDHEQGMMVFGAWILMVEIASKSNPRGLLLRSGLKPHDAGSLARMSRRKVEEFEIAIPALLDIGWLGSKDFTEDQLRVLSEDPAPPGEEVPMEGNGPEGNGPDQKGRKDGLDPSILEKQKNITRARTLAYSEIIPYLNEKTSRRFSVLNKVTQRHINARLSEGYTIEDFKTVIDKKVTEWLHDPKMSPYLRPQTLFAGKFEAYLNQPEIGPGGKTTVSERTGFIK
jgi:uncharacterized phage protein (TIGR02220 family)